MINRRDFLKGSAALSSLMLLPSCATQKVKRANSQVQVAIVGAGGQGGRAVERLSQSPHSKIVAFCDVDEKRAANAYKQFPNVARFRDYRVMLDKMDKDIDAVAVCTPDHMHYPICAWAISKGKNVFCEKPLTRTIWESNKLKQLAEEAKVFTQMGNQGHTNEGWRLIKEWANADIIGKVEDIYVWTNRPIWPQGELKMPPAQAIPSTLDYNLWRGVAPYQPYNEAILPFKWRGLRNYGTGAAGDMACHFLDVPYAAFDLGFPKTITANSSPFNDYSWPNQASSTMIFENNLYGANGKIALHWYDGGRRPKEIKRVDSAFLTDPRNQNCTFIVGTKATVLTDEYGLRTTIFPRLEMREMVKSGKLPPKTIPRSDYHGNPHAEWVAGIINGVNGQANFSYAAPFTEMVMLGMVAILEPNKPLHYDPAKLEFTNCPEANKYVRSLYAYREEFLPSKLDL